MKILVYLTGGVHWLGGVQYTRNLLKALASLPFSQQPGIVLKIGSKNEGLNFGAEFRNQSNIVLDGPVKAGRATYARWIDLFRRVFQRVTRLDLPANILLSDECSVAFPVKGPNVRGNAQNVYWIPDFQYKHFPQFFPEEERRERDAMYEKMLSEDGILVVSSDAVGRDFRNFFPQFKDKVVRVLRFCSVIDDDAFTANAAEVCDRYQLPEKFVYLPNQLWQHKGFETAFKAIGLLMEEGLQIPLVSTGSKDDYRNSAYFKSLQKILQEHGVEQQIIMLGMVPREDQVQIFRRAAFVLQPSRFEGWSTTVEDAKALGKRIVVSDIDVHIEQNPPHATFFKTGDGADLAEKIKGLWLQLSAGPDMALEKEARLQGKKRARKYALDFIEIMKDAEASHWVKNLKEADKAQEELRLGALHQLLPETLTSEAVGPRFSKFVRHRRELFHPLGRHEVAEVSSTTGLKFNVDLGDHLGCDLYYGMFNEQSEYELFRALVSPGDTVVDVGANIGLYALLGAMRAGPEGRVVAFEPDQRALELLRKNISSNSLEGRVQLQPICVGSYNGTTAFNEAEQASFSGIVDTGRARVENVRQVPIRKLDDLLPELGVADIAFLKIDVEGTESQVLAGAIAMLKKSDAIIEIEISTKNSSSAENRELQRSLTLLEAELDYQAYCLSQDHTRLIRFPSISEIFSDRALVTRNNYFLVRRTHGKTALIEETFASSRKFILSPNRFFEGRLGRAHSKQQLAALAWAERERGLIAIGRADSAWRRSREKDNLSARA